MFWVSSALNFLIFHYLKDYLRLVFINKENRKYFPQQKLLTLESGSQYTIWKGLVSQGNRASARLQKKKKITGKLQLSFQKELSALPPAFADSALDMWQS